MYVCYGIRSHLSSKRAVAEGMPKQYMLFLTLTKIKKASLSTATTPYKGKHKQRYPPANCVAPASHSGCIQTHTARYNLNIAHKPKNLSRAHRYR